MMGLGKAISYHRLLGRSITSEARIILENRKLSYARFRGEVDLTQKSQKVEIYRLIQINPI